MAVKFSLDDAQRAYDEWHCNCGPGALAAITNLTLDEVRPHLGEFERKHYTNPSMMYAALQSLGVRWTGGSGRLQVLRWPTYGLARIQWFGPWTAPGVPMRVRYQHTHWVGAQWLEDKDDYWIFDINCLCVGGWVAASEWSSQVVPWLLKETEPKATGQWSITHALEVQNDTRSLPTLR